MDTQQGSIDTQNKIRLGSLDVMRGAAMIGVIVIHAIVFGIFTPDPAVLNELLDRAPLILLIFFAPVYYLASWYTIFVFVNGVTLGLAFAKHIGAGDSHWQKTLLYKKLLNGLLIIVIGGLYSPLFATTAVTEGVFRYSFITGSIFTGSLQPVNWQLFLHHGVFAGIAYSLITVVLTLYGATIYLQRRDTLSVESLRKVIIAAMIGSLLFALLLEIIFGKPSRQDLSLTGEILIRFYGLRHSLFPQVAFGFAGAVFGLEYRNYLRDPRILTQFSKYAGIGLFLSFVIYSLLTGMNIVSALVAEVHPVMIQVMYLALNIGLMFVLMKNMDRGGTPSARTQYLRRLGLMSMTIFFLEPVIGATLRRLYIAIFGPDIFPWNFIPAISYIVLLVVIWSLIARYWSRRQYVGSFEWLITWIMMRLGAPTKRLDTSSL